MELLIILPKEVENDMNDQHDYIILKEIKYRLFIPISIQLF